MILAVCTSWPDVISFHISADSSEFLCKIHFYLALLLTVYDAKCLLFKSYIAFKDYRERGAMLET